MGRGKLEDIQDFSIKHQTIKQWCKYVQIALARVGAVQKGDRVCHISGSAGSCMSQNVCPSCISPLTPSVLFQDRVFNLEPDFVEKWGLTGQSVFLTHLNELVF